MTAGLRVSGHAVNLFFCASVLSAAAVRNSGASALVQLRSLLLRTGSGGITPRGGYGCGTRCEANRRRLFSPTCLAKKNTAGVSAAEASSSASFASSAAPPEQIVTLVGESQVTAVLQVV